MPDLELLILLYVISLVNAITKENEMSRLFAIWNFLKICVLLHVDGVRVHRTIWLSSKYAFKFFYNFLMPNFFIFVPLSFRVILILPTKILRFLFCSLFKFIIFILYGSYQTKTLIYSAIGLGEIKLHVPSIAFNHNYRRNKEWGDAMSEKTFETD